MFQTLDYYALEIIKLLKEISKPGYIEYISAITPSLISLLALFISWLGKKNTDAIQKKIASSEERAFRRKIIFDLYDTFMNQETVYCINESLFLSPLASTKVATAFENHLLELYKNRNRLALITLEDKSKESRDLINSTNRALKIYTSLRNKLIEFLVNGELKNQYEHSIKKLTEYYQNNFNENEIYSNQEKRSRFVQYMSESKTVKDILKLQEDYIQATSSENLDHQIKQFLDKLSNQ